MQQPAIVFFDIDETLYHQQAGVVPPSTIAALAALRERGILTAIATGRSPGIFPAAVREVVAQFGMEVIVSINGQYCTYQGKPLVTHPLPPDYIAALIALCRSRGWGYMQMTAEQLLASHDDAHMRTIYQHIAPYQVRPEGVRDEAVYQMNVVVDEAGEAQLRASGILGAAYQSIRWHAQSVDVLPREGSKARGVEEVCAHLGIARERVMVFGDGLNDVEMFRHAGFAVAMGNARAELKAIADYVTREVGDDGIWHALHTLGVIS